jgi:hypothetical protein
MSGKNHESPIEPQETRPLRVLVIAGSQRRLTGGANAKITPRQWRTEGRVMHEFERGELKSGQEGKGGKVRNRKQAIAIAVSEAGASKYESRHKKRSNRAKTERKKAKGETGQQERDGKSRIGAQGTRSSYPR